MKTRRHYGNVCKVTILLIFLVWLWRLSQAWAQEPVRLEPDEQALSGWTVRMKHAGVAFASDMLKTKNGYLVLSNLERSDRSREQGKILYMTVLSEMDKFGNVISNHEIKKGEITRGHSLSSLPNGNFLLAGRQDDAAFWTEVNEHGEEVWYKTFVPKGTQTAEYLRALKIGENYLVLERSLNQGGRVKMYAKDFSEGWSRDIFYLAGEPLGSGTPQWMEVDEKNQRIYVSAYFPVSIQLDERQNVKFDRAFFLLCINFEGKPLWKRKFWFRDQYLQAPELGYRQTFAVSDQGIMILGTKDDSAIPTLMRLDSDGEARDAFSFVDELMTNVFSFRGNFSACGTAQEKNFVCRIFVQQKREIKNITLETSGDPSKIFVHRAIEGHDGTIVWAGVEATAKDDDDVVIRWQRVEKE